MYSPDHFSSLHGVMLNISGKGVLLLGAAGIGKSSLALELLHHGHQLIADDVVDFISQGDIIVAQCPKFLSGLLHTRELGVIDVNTVFQHQAWQFSHRLDYVVKLEEDYRADISVSTNENPYFIMGKALPCLRLNVRNPASIPHRLLTWLELKKHPHHPESLIAQRQQMQTKTL